MKHLKLASILLTVSLASLSAQEAEIDNSLQGAFANGTIKGTIGTYGEYIEEDESSNGYGWMSAYLELQYKTQEWNNLQFEATFVGHSEVWEDSAEDEKDRFDKDIEQTSALAEAYIKANIGEASSITAGRVNHKKISHIDDAQSEGLFFQVKASKKILINGGIVNRFAEIDYDDIEDFGQKDNKQDLGNEDVYGEGSGEFLYFIEAEINLMENASINPYLMVHEDYATVIGSDADISFEASDDLILGSEFSIYYSDFEKDDADEDATVYAIKPYLKAGPFTASIGYIKFDSDDSSANKPKWLNDYLIPLDQTGPYGLADQDVYFAKVGAKFGSAWAHVAYANYSHDQDEDFGDGSDEIEFQAGYKFAGGFDINLRLFDVSFDNIDDEDYQKVEFRGRFRF